MYEKGSAYLCCPATAAIRKLYLCDLENHTIARLNYCGEITLQGTFFNLSGICHGREFCCYSRLNLGVCPPGPCSSSFCYPPPSELLSPFFFFFSFFFGAVLRGVSGSVGRKPWSLEPALQWKGQELHGELSVENTSGLQGLLLHLLLNRQKTQKGRNWKGKWWGKQGRGERSKG